MPKLIVALAAIALLLLAAPAHAHGVKSTDHRTAPRDFSWLSLLSPARAAATVRIDSVAGFRFITSDGMPDHYAGPFPTRGNPNRMSPQNYSFRVRLNPEKAGQVMPLRRSYNFGVALNGVPFDPATAEFWGNPRLGWSVEALGGAMDLGIDRSNAHVQPNGAYHYHGIPVGLLQRFAQNQSPILIGYAADGFPIYGPYGHRDAGDAASPLVELRSGWRLKQGTRPHGPGVGPGGQHNGYYTEDWEFAGIGDLDQCNGRGGVTPEHPQGTYYYVVTAAFPMVPRCFAGMPDPSFDKGPPGGGPPGGGPGRPPPPR